MTDEDEIWRELRILSLQITGLTAAFDAMEWRRYEKEGLSRKEIVMRLSVMRHMLSRKYAEEVERIDAENRGFKDQEDTTS